MTHCAPDFVGILAGRANATPEHRQVSARSCALKHRRLYLHRLDTLDAVQRLVAQYVGDHNGLILRVELGGRTPTEAYEGRPAPALEDACREARARRLEANRRTSCGVCDEPPCERVEP